MKVDIGPITRIEGHLNIKTSVVGHKIIEAQAMGEMFRGFEIFLKGRDPLDAQQMTQRVCGVCPYAHGIASSYAQEDAYGITPPPNGRILHNLIQGANHLYDYILHFYHLAALDFVDIKAVLSYYGKDPALLAVKSWVSQELRYNKASPAAPFLPRLSGQYIKDKNINVGAIHNYLEALSVQQRANEACTIFGGKFPHSVSVFPGGCTQEVTIDKVVKYQELIKQVKYFILSKYIPDLEAVARAFPFYWKIGKSKGGFLSYGLFPLSPDKNAQRLFAPGFLHGKSISHVDYDSITEDISYSKYSSPNGLRVRDGETIPDSHKHDAYSWTKAPRYNNYVTEVGALARVLVDYYSGNNKTVRSLVKKYAAKFNIKVSQLNSVLGRHLCRGICAVTIADFLLEESERLTVGDKTMTEPIVPKEAEGFGATEASRGALLHYLKVKDYKIDKYQLVVPTTWNVSPKDSQRRRGPIESALIGTWVEDAKSQIEAGRIVRSFDPCIACSVH